MAFIIETVEIVDEEGNVIDRADLEPPPELDPAPSVADAVDADSVEDSIEVAGTTDAETDTEEGTK